MFDVSHFPVLLLNGDYRPLSVYPLSTLSQEKALKGLYEDTHVRVADYDVEIHSPSTTMFLPSVVALKRYIKRPHQEFAPFNRFNVFLRDKFCCQYCGTRDMRNLTFDHVVPQVDGGKSTWNNVVAACPSCNTKKGHLRSWKPKRAPYEPTWEELEHNKYLFPPNFLHESWIDYLFWDTPIDPE